MAQNFLFASLEIYTTYTDILIRDGISVATLWFLLTNLQIFLKSWAL